MKNKRKWMSLVGSAAVVVPLALTATSCSCTYKKEKEEDEPDPQPDTPTHEDEYVAPKVTFTGDPEMKPNSGVISSTLAGFKLSRKLYDNETLTVKVTQLENDAVTISAKEQYSPNTDNFSVVFSVTVPKPELYNSATVKCKLSFEFSYKSKSVKQDLDDTFTYYYSPEWEPNSVTGTLETYTPTYTEDGLIFNVTDDLKLARDLKENETIEVKPVDSNIQLIGTPSITERRLSLSFVVLGQSQYEDYGNDDFALNFSFKRNSIQVRDDQKVTGGKIAYSRVCEDIELNVSDKSILNAKPADGQLVHSIADGSLRLSRVLKQKFSEQIKLELINIKKDGADAPGSLEIHFDEEDEPDYNNQNLTGVYVKYNLKDADKYKPAHFTYDLKWTVSEISGESWTDTFVGNTFDYTPIWRQKTVVAYGYNTEQDKKFTTAKGSPNINISSLVEKGFKVVGDKLEEKESVQVKVIPKAAESKLNVTPITATADSLSYDETLLSFSVGFDNNYILQNPYVSITESFTLSFTFIKQIGSGQFVSEPQPISTEFSITYTPQDRPSYDKLMPTINNSSDDEVKSGDTVFTLRGKLNRPMDNQESKNDTLVNVSVADEDKTLASVIKSSGSGTDYEHGAKITGTDVEMIVRLDNITNYSANESFNISFDFTFHRYDSTATIDEDYIAKVEDVTITYKGFSTNIDEYIQARSLPMSLYYVQSTTGTVTNYNTQLLNAWIVGDATPNDLTDFKFHIATTWDQKIAFEKFRSSHQGDVTFRIGISDSSFAENYIDIHTKEQKFNGQVPMNNYLYCNLTNESVFSWEKEQSTFYYELYQQYSHSNRAANIYVGTLDFNNAWSDYEGKEVNNVEWLIAFANKLNQLNNYQHCYGCINTMIANPIHDTDQRKARYDDFGVGGYPSHVQYEFSEENAQEDDSWFIQMNYVDWYYTSISSNNILYGDAEYLRGKSSDGNGEKIISNASYSTSVRHSCPVYYTNENGKMNRGSQQVYYYYDENGNINYNRIASYGDYDLEAMDGALVATHDLSATGNKPKIVVAGSFWGWLSNISSSTSSFVPYIDILAEGNKQLLKKYGVKFTTD